MTELAETTVAKLTILKNISQYSETKELAKIMIEYVRETDKKEMGFKSEKIIK